MAILVQSGDPGREKTPPRLREDLRQRRPRAAAVTEFDAALTTLGIKHRSAAQWFRTSERNIRRWKSGARRTPPGVMVTVRLMMAGKVGPADVELAAGPAPARTNGRAKPEPPAPQRAEPAPKQSASARAKTATLAEKLLALVPGTCRWPCGDDPQHPDFYFCSAPTAKPPYCPRHRAVAYLAPRAGRFVTYGRHGRPSIPDAFSATSASRAPKVLLDRAGDLPGSAPPPA